MPDTWNQLNQDIITSLYYNEVGKGKVCALINSAGYLEIAVNGGNAARRYNLAIGTSISVMPSDKI